MKILNLNENALNNMKAESQITEQVSASGDLASAGCFGSFGTLGTAGGCAACFGTYGCGEVMQ